MIGKITPLVQEAKRTWWSASVGHVVGATLSGSVLGFLLGACGLVAGLGRYGLVTQLIGSGIFLACALRDVGIIRCALPSLQRQTPAWCLCTFGPKWGGFAWGGDLGQGWTTFIVFTGYYGLVWWCVLSASPILGGLILGAYGLGRAMPVMFAGLLAQRTELWKLSSMYTYRLVGIQWMNALALAFTAGYFIMQGLAG